MNDFSGIGPAKIRWDAGGNSGFATFGDDSRMIIIFHKKSVENAAKSRLAGRPVFESQDYIRIQPPGERLNIVDRPVTENDKYTYALKWSQYLQNQTQVPEGSPIELLFPNNPAVADNLKSMNVFTVEQCANLSGNAIDTIGLGATDWKNKAQKYLDSASKGVQFHQLQKQLEEQQTETRVANRKVEMLQEQLRLLEARLNNPNTQSLSPQWAPNYDPQTERINANSSTALAEEELAKATGRRTRTRPKAPQSNPIDEYGKDGE